MKTLTWRSHKEGFHRAFFQIGRLFRLVCGRKFTYRLRFPQPDFKVQGKLLRFAWPIRYNFRLLPTRQHKQNNIGLSVRLFPDRLEFRTYTYLDYHIPYEDPLHPSNYHLIRVYDQSYFGRTFRMTYVIRDYKVIYHLNVEGPSGQENEVFHMDLAHVEPPSLFFRHGLYSSGHNFYDNSRTDERRYTFEYEV